jgi:hypothetical protein
MSALVLQDVEHVAKGSNLLGAGWPSLVDRKRAPE